MGEQSLVTCLGLTAGDSFSPNLLVHPLPTSPQFVAHPRRFSLTRLLEVFAWNRRGNGCYAVYCFAFQCSKILPLICRYLVSTFLLALTIYVHKKKKMAKSWLRKMEMSKPHIEIRTYLCPKQVSRNHAQALMCVVKMM